MKGIYGRWRISRRDMLGCVSEELRVFFGSGKEIVKGCWGVDRNIS